MNNAKYSLIESFNLLDSKIRQLNQRIVQQTSINAVVFRLPNTIKGDENREVNEIIVNKVTGQEAIKDAIEHFSLLFIHDKSDVISNKSAIRLPGAICIDTPYSTYMEFETLLNEINTSKSQIKQIVTKLSGIDESQRFEFIHSSLHGLLTLNTYRALTHLTDVDTVRFGWANKKVINKITKEHVLDKLQATLENGRKPQGMESESWAGQIEQEILLIRRLSHNAVLKTQRPVKVQPIARVWDKVEQKQTQFACANPLIIFAVEKSLDDILIGSLPNYHADVIALRNRPRAKPVELLIPRLNLYIEQ